MDWVEFLLPCHVRGCRLLDPGTSSGCPGPSSPALSTSSDGESETSLGSGAGASPLSLGLGQQLTVQRFREFVFCELNASIVLGIRRWIPGFLKTLETAFIDLFKCAGWCLQLQSNFECCHSQRPGESDGKLKAVHLYVWGALRSRMSHLLLRVWCLTLLALHYRHAVYLLSKWCAGQEGLSQLWDLVSCCYN